MKLTLKRFQKSDKTIIGRLYVDGKFECYTLEDRDRNLSSSMSIAEIQQIKVYGNTAIPRGTYDLVVQLSPSNGKRYFYLQNVKGFTGVRIEWGNTQVDTLGCILLGTAYETDKVTNSVVAYNTLVKRMNLTKGHTITIMDDSKAVSNTFWIVLACGIILTTVIFRATILNFFKKRFKKQSLK